MAKTAKQIQAEYKGDMSNCVGRLEGIINSILRELGQRVVAADNFKGLPAEISKQKGGFFAGVDPEWFLKRVIRSTSSASDDIRELMNLPPPRFIQFYLKDGGHFEEKKNRGVSQGCAVAESFLKFITFNPGDISCVSDLIRLTSFEVGDPSRIREGVKLKTRLDALGEKKELELQELKKDIEKLRFFSGLYFLLKYICQYIMLIYGVTATKDGLFPLLCKCVDQAILYESKKIDIEEKDTLPAPSNDDEQDIIPPKKIDKNKTGFNHSKAEVIIQQDSNDDEQGGKVPPPPPPPPPPLTKEHPNLPPVKSPQDENVQSPNGVNADAIADMSKRLKKVDPSQVNCNKQSSDFVNPDNLSAAKGKLKKVNKEQIDAEKRAGKEAAKEAAKNSDSLSADELMEAMKSRRDNMELSEDQNDSEGDNEVSDNSAW